MKKIGKYGLIEKLGGGVLGTVFKGYDSGSGRQVAIRIFTENIKWEPRLEQRFQAGCKAVAGLKHTHIAGLLDYGKEGETGYVVTEYLEGWSLKALIAESTTMPMETKLSIVAQAGEGLAYAHSLGAIHGDIKPGNIHLAADGTVKLLDFGIRHILAPELNSMPQPTGLPAYFAPEQLRHQPQTELSDMFSLGLTFYELVTGRHPFHDQDNSRAAENVLHQADFPTVERYPNLPLGLWVILEKCLARNPEDRYGNMTEFVGACRKLAGDLAEDSQLMTIELQSVLPRLRQAVNRPGSPPELALLLRDIEKTLHDKGTHYLSLNRLVASLAENYRLIHEVSSQVPPGSIPTAVRDAELPLPAGASKEAIPEDPGRQAGTAGMADDILGLMATAADDTNLETAGDLETILPALAQDQAAAAKTSAPHSEGPAHGKKPRTKDEVTAEAGPRDVSVEQVSADDYFLEILKTAGRDQAVPDRNAKAESPPEADDDVCAKPQPDAAGHFDSLAPAGTRSRGELPVPEGGAPPSRDSNMEWLFQETSHDHEGRPEAWAGRFEGEAGSDDPAAADEAGETVSFLRGEQRARILKTVLYALSGGMLLFFLIAAVQSFRGDSAISGPASKFISGKAGGNPGPGRSGEPEQDRLLQLKRDVLLEEAQMLRIEGRYNESTVFLKRLLEIQPACEPALAELEQIQAESSGNKKGQEPDLARLLAGASALIASGRLARANSEIARIERLSPNRPETADLRRRLKAKQAEADLALKMERERQLEDERKLRAEQEFSRQMEGFYREARYDEAVAFLDKKLAETPQDSSAREHRARAVEAQLSLKAYESALKAKRYQEALNAVDTLERINPADPNLSELRGQAQNRQASARASLSIRRASAPAALLLDDQPLGGDGELTNHAIGTGRHKAAVRNDRGLEASYNFDAVDGQRITLIYDARQPSLRPMEESDRERIEKRKTIEQTHRFKVGHNHGFLRGSCKGELIVNYRDVEYRPDSGTHGFIVPFRDLRLSVEGKSIALLFASDGKELAGFKAEDAEIAQALQALWEELEGMVP